jgi:hypothetical protein
LIKIKPKAFSVIEFLIASVLTVAVVGSSTIGIGLAEKIQRDTYYIDLMNQVANSIIQGSRSLNCGISFTDKTDVACKGKYSNITKQEIEINSAVNLDPTKKNDGVIFPNSDGVFKYTISNRSYIKVTLSTTWLEAGSTDSCYNSKFLDPEDHPQPNMFLRKLVLAAYEGNREISSKKYTDIQAVSLFTEAIKGDSSGDTYSVGYKPNSTNINQLYTAKFTYAGKEYIVNRFEDHKGCIWFPFVGRNVVSTIDKATGVYSNPGSNRPGRYEA